MTNLKDLKSRIATVRSTQKITKAMQMVAASKLRRAQERLDAALPYLESFDKVLHHSLSHVEQSHGLDYLLRGTGNDKTHLLLVITADRGLCGGFNGALVRKARDYALTLESQGKTVKFFCIGRKGAEALRATFKDSIVNTVSYAGNNFVGMQEALAVKGQLMEILKKKTFDVCTMFFAHFETVMSQVPTMEQLIPVLPPQGENSNDGGESPSLAPARQVSASLAPARASVEDIVYDYEPEQSELLTQLLPYAIAVRLLKAFLNTAVGEQGARMTAMDSATRNAGEMIDGLTVTYNRTRQATITKELIEIISGAEAL